MINVGGLTLYRPSVSVTTDFKSDSNGNNVGQRDNVTINDTALYDDTADLMALYNSLVELAIQGSPVEIDYPGNSGTVGTIKDFSIDESSDFVNIFSYSLIIEAIPTRSLYSIYDIEDVSGLLTSLTMTENWNYPYDLSQIELPETDGSTGIYYNKTINYDFNLSFSCGHNPSGGQELQESKEVADLVLESLGRDSPSSGLVEDMSEYTGGPVSIKLGRSEDGTTSLNIRSVYLPTGNASTSGLFTVDVSKVSTVDKIGFNADRSLKISVTALPIGLEYETTTSGTDKIYTVTGWPSGLADSAFAKCTGILQSFIDTSGILEVENEQPGKVQSCTLPRTKLTTTGCFNTKSFSIDKNYSNNSATLNIEQTTQNIGNCDFAFSGYRVNYSVVKHPRDKNKVYAEPKGWSSTGYWVQDMNTFKDNYYEYTINLDSMLKCAPTGTGIKGLAMGIFNGINILEPGSGIITSKVFSINNNSCSLKITQYSGTNLSTSGIGYESGIQ